MANVPDRPASEHPKDVRRWVLECLAVLWTESGTDWKTDAKKSLLIRSEGDFTFEIFMRPSQRVRTGFVKCFPHWRIQSQRWSEWSRKRRAPSKFPHLFDYPLRELRRPGLSPSQWLFVSPIGIAALYEPERHYGGQAPIPDLRNNASPIFNAIHDADAFQRLAQSTNLDHMTGASTRAEYLVAIGRPDLAQAELLRWQRCLSHDEIIALGLSVPEQS